MSWADDMMSSVQKALGEKPVVLLVGASDLVTQKLRELPEAVSAWQAENRDLPLRAAGAVVGSAFRANLKIGELYDELSRRGEDVMTKMRGEPVYAEEDEPFVHEPFMPVPVRTSAGSTTRPSTKKAAARTSKQAAPNATPTRSTAKAATKKGTSSAAKAAARKAPAKSATKKTAPRKRSRD